MKDAFKEESKSANLYRPRKSGLKEKTFLTQWSFEDYEDDPSNEDFDYFEVSPQSPLNISEDLSTFLVNRQQHKKHKKQTIRISTKEMETNKSQPIYVEINKNSLKMNDYEIPKALQDLHSSSDSLIFIYYNDMRYSCSSEWSLIVALTLPPRFLLQHSERHLTLLLVQIASSKGISLCQGKVAVDNKTVSWKHDFETKVQTLEMFCREAVQHHGGQDRGVETVELEILCQVESKLRDNLTPAPPHSALLTVDITSARVAGPNT